MALTTTYIVVPFLLGGANALHPGNPRRTARRGAAIAMADGLAQFYAGAIVLRDRSDAAAGVFLEPLLVFATGRVPGDLMEDIAA